MPTQGGPSRRSHTKSRKGCKTCKRRHIRCDETYPQCRNCSKHQVRCDYMDGMTDTESQQSPEQGSVTLTPGSESHIDAWQQSGSFPYPNLEVFPHPQPQELSRDDLRLVHHLLSLTNNLHVKGTSNLTIWTAKMPKFLSIASSYPYVMQALLSFSANHLAWERSSKETRNLHIHHGAIALGGLHEAIGNFSGANADAVLATSLLLLWQATDWRSWSSLRAGIQSVLGAMHSWKGESRFAEFIVEEDLLADAYRTHRRRPSILPNERSMILQNAIAALQRLQTLLVGQQMETHWVDQLLTFLQTILTLDPPTSPEEQFNQLYHLRKWLFWVPVQLLQRPDGQGPAMLTLAHFYATALAVEPLFPDLGSSFCAAMSLAPLESIINLTEAMRSENAMDSNAVEIAQLMQWPQQTALLYRARAMQPLPSLAQDPVYNIGPETLRSTTMGNISPAFAPSSLHYGGGYGTPTSQTSSRPSSFLEVPNVYPGATGFSYGTETWGAVPSPGLPATDFLAAASSQEDTYGGYEPDLGAFHGGTLTDIPDSGPSFDLPPRQ